MNHGEIHLMDTDDMKRVALTILACVLVAAFAMVAPALAEEHAGPWSTGVRGLYSWYSHQYSYPYQGVSNNLDIENGVGFGAFVNFRPTHRYGFELALSQLSFDAVQTSVPTYPIPGPPIPVGSGTFGLRSALGSFYVYFSPSDRFDLYFGPTAGWTDFDEDVGVPREAELTYGATLGLSAPIGSTGWYALLDYRYLKTNHETMDRDFYGDLAFPSLGLGVAYRF